MYVYTHSDIHNRYSIIHVVGYFYLDFIFYFFIIFFHFIHDILHVSMPFSSRA